MSSSVPSLPPLPIGSLQLHPPFIFAPMAGVSHSALRRLLADFGGYGALYTEMLSSRALYHENLHASPFTRRRPEEGTVVYQLLVDTPDAARAAVHRLNELAPPAIDINLGCPAPEIKKRGGGAALFLDTMRLELVLQTVRREWPGPLLVKCRLGEQRPDWRTALDDRLHLFEHCGVDAVIVHPRFLDEKLKRTARWDELERIASKISLPVIGNGDITCASDLRTRLHRYPAVAGFMVGRAAVARPWLFSEAAGGMASFEQVDYLEIWQRFFRYVCEDFEPHKAIGRIKEYTAYFARNFMFGHELFRASQSASSLDELCERACRFLNNHPRAVATPSFSGL